MPVLPPNRDNVSCHFGVFPSGLFFGVMHMHLYLCFMCVHTHTHKTEVIMKIQLISPNHYQLLIVMHAPILDIKTLSVVP